ncbi:hypothetical protein N4G70_34960 [Streptomyces sp. ASQP_92]|uniref:hypothetical protein n=1 Tax=Streptomyces sp. ASQP_92 TaxID=2979116 RepID=UPI0021BFFC71|nr:hypothetical protein [Streptomyces sp. ASQP_92]MCT9094020.1 hypothetical protein [Streptomyces sp. ASQP_92]
MPVRLIGRTLGAILHASDLVVHDGRDEVARHERLIAKGGSRASFWAATWPTNTRSPALRRP